MGVDLGSETGMTASVLETAGWDADQISSLLSCVSIHLLYLGSSAGSITTKVTAPVHENYLEHFTNMAKNEVERAFHMVYQIIPVFMNVPQFPDTVEISVTVLVLCQA